jgi:hypothetical protein
MVPYRLRIPVALTWSALAGAMVSASGACSATSSAGRAAIDGGEIAMDASGPGEAGPTPLDGAPADGLGATEAAVTPAECLGRTAEGGFTTFSADGATCPDGDVTV